jgi:hypothetical protein
MMQQTKMKYAWDITCEREFSDSQLKTIDQISEMISKGGNVAELKQKMRFAKISML